MPFVYVTPFETIELKGTFGEYLAKMHSLSTGDGRKTEVKNARKIIARSDKILTELSAFAFEEGFQVRDLFTGG